MASVTLTGTLLDPTGEVAVGDQIRFTHRTTTGETIKFARSVLTIPPNGLYNITLEFGLIFVEYLDIKDVNYKSLGVVTVNGDTTATDLPGLLNAIVPPTDAQLILFQAILADTEDARDIALLAAAQQTMLELIASTTTHPAGTVLTLSGHTLSGDGGGGKWKLNGVVGQTLSQSPTQLADFLLNDGNGNQWALVFGQILAFNGVQYLPLPFGASGNGSYSYNDGEFSKISDLDRLNPATVAVMVADNSLILNDIVGIQDYATGHNSGLMIGRIVAGGTGTEDGGKFIDLDNGLQFKQNFPSPNNVKLFGSAGDGVRDDTTSNQATYTYLGGLPNGGVAHHPAGAYKTTATLFYTASLVGWTGEGKLSSVIRFDNVAGGTAVRSHSDDANTTITHCMMKDLGVVSTSVANSPDVCLDVTGFSFSHFSNFSLQTKRANGKCWRGQGNNGSGPYYNTFDSFVLAGDATTRSQIGLSFEGGSHPGGSNGPNANNFSNLQRAFDLDILCDLKVGNGNNFSNIGGESIKTAYFNINENPAVDSGTSTGGNSQGSLIDTGKSFTVNGFVNGGLKITGGTGSGQTRRIISNTATTFSLFPVWTITPDATSTYEVYDGKGRANHFINIRAEGLASLNPNFIVSHPGATKNKFYQMSIESLGSGSALVDTQKDPSNTYLDGDLITLTFGVEDLAANNTTILTVPTTGVSLPQKYIIENISTFSAPNRSGGSAIVNVKAGNEYTVTTTTDAEHLNQTWSSNSNHVPVDNLNDKLVVEVVTDAGWLPATVDMTVTVSIRLVNS